jgi:vacuolar protein sorting-associated protein 29
VSSSRVWARSLESCAWVRVQLPNKMHHILCTGNLCSKEQLEALRALAPNVHVTAGDFDDVRARSTSVWLVCLVTVCGRCTARQELRLPETKVVTIGAFKIGLCHGHQVVPWGEAEALAALRREVRRTVCVSVLIVDPRRTLLLTLFLAVAPLR